MAWIIEDEEGLVWSNAEGFTEGDDFETFSNEERELFNLPLGGHWVEVSWNVP